MSRPVTTLRSRLGAAVAALTLSLALGACHDGSSATTTTVSAPGAAVATGSPGAPAPPPTVAPPSSVATAVPAPTMAVPVSTTAGATTDAEATTAPAPPPPAATAVTSTMASAPAVIAPPPSADATASATGLPAIDARAYAVYDASAGRWLAGSDADTPLAVGSLMKLLTAYVVMQAGDPTHVVTVPEMTTDPSESAIGLYRGEQLQRDLLVRAMLIVSANDAARALAIDLAGSEEAFAAQMNAAAADLGMTGTSAANPVGLDASYSFSTAHDMTTLAATLMQDETFRATVARTDATLHGQVFPATNALLTSYPGANGVKTGHTTEAGWSLVGAAERDGRQVIVTVLGASSSTARVASASALLDWAFAQP